MLRHLGPVIYDLNTNTRSVSKQPMRKQNKDNGLNVTKDSSR